MPVNFFEKEVRRFRERFNRIFGSQIVCNMEARQTAIMSLAWLGLLAEKIISAKEKEKARDVIREFYDIRGSLNRSFDLIERRIRDAGNEHGPGYGSGGGSGLQQLRKRVQV